MKFIMIDSNRKKEHFILLNDSSYNTISYCIAEWLCDKSNFIFGKNEYQKLIENGYCFLPSVECKFSNQCDKQDDIIKFCQANNEIRLELIEEEYSK